MINHIQLKRNMSKIFQNLKTEDYERRTFSFKRYLERELNKRGY